jgi:hypothetical protein
VRLADYTNKFFDFLAENLRRLAEFLSAPPIKNNDFGDEKDSSPPADWLEKTRGIPSEQWIDFSGEAADNFGAVLPPTNSLITKPDEKVLDRTSSALPPTSSPIKKSGEKVFEPAIPKPQANSETESESVGEISLPPKPKTEPPKPKTDRRFLSFKFLDKKPSEKTVEAPSPPTKTSHEAVAESEKTPASPKRKFRLLPASPIFGKKPKTDVSAAPPILFSGKKTSQPNQTAFVFGQGKPGELINKSVSPKPKSAGAKETQIINKRVSRKELPPETFPRKNLGQTKAETIENKLKMPNKKTPVDFIFTPKVKDAAETSDFFPAWEKSTNALPEDPKPNVNRENDDAGDNFIFAAPLWTDLPDENSSGAFDEIELSRSEFEHLLYLEREQGGHKYDKN